MVWRDDAKQLCDSFHEDGFVTIRGFFDREQVNQVRVRVDRLINDVVHSMPPENVFYEDKNDPATLKQIQQLGQYDPWFIDLCMRGPVRDTAKMLLDDDVVLKNIQYFNKPPLIGKPTPPHQDGYYFIIEPNEAVTMWLALDEVDESNGCVRYVKGSHRQPMRDHARTNTLGFSQGITDFGTADDQSNEVAIESQPGDLLAHHAMTIHRAGANTTTDRPRRALGFIYYAASAREDKEAHEAYQRKLAEELAKAGKI